MSKYTQRYIRRKSEGRCVRCGIPTSRVASGAWTLCEACQKKASDAQRKRRKDRVSKGLCECCGKNALRKGFKTCMQCAVKNSEYSLKYYYERTKREHGKIQSR